MSWEGLVDVMCVKEVLELEIGIGKDEVLDCVCEEDYEVLKYKVIIWDF